MLGKFLNLYEPQSVLALFLKSEPQTVVPHLLLLSEKESPCPTF